MPDTQYATVQNAPWGIGTLTPILIDPTTVTWNRDQPPSWVPCWIVWDNGNGTFSGVGWHIEMPMYIPPVADYVENYSATPPQPTIS